MKITMPENKREFHVSCGGKKPIGNFSGRSFRNEIKFCPLVLEEPEGF